MPRVGRLVFYLSNCLIVVFLVMPFVAIIPMSFSSAMFLTFPPPSFSTKWYNEFFTSIPWNNAAILSFEVAALAAVFASLLGTMAALGIGQKIYSKKIALVRPLLAGLFVLPAICPVVVTAVAELMFYLKIGLYDTKCGIVIAYTVLGIPFVFITVLASLNSVDRSIEKAASNLGASHLQTLFRVTLPLIRSGIFLGAIFAFMNSFNEIVVTVFITGTSTVTLSRKLWDGIQYDIDPIITVVSTLLTGFSVMILLVSSFARRKSSRVFWGF